MSAAMMSTTLPDPEHDAQFYDGVPGRRAAAFLIDTVLLLIADLAIWVVLGILGVLTFGLGWVLIAPAILITGFLYRWGFLAHWSATPGMYITGLQIRGPDGRRLNGVQAFVHTFGFYVTLISIILLLISAGFSLANPRGRMFHDLLIGSTAINRPA